MATLLISPFSNHDTLEEGRKIALNKGEAEGLLLVGQDSIQKAHVFSKQGAEWKGEGIMRHSAIGRLKRRRWSLIFGKKQEREKANVKR